MSRTSFGSVAAVLLILLPSQVLAGGLPRLCLPIDVRDTANTQADFETLLDSLRNQLERCYGSDGVKLHQHDNQWYATITLERDVSLQDVAVALKDSPFFVPLERLRLFGIVILELKVDTAATLTDELLSDLEALEHVSVEKSQRAEDVLLVTLETPYRLTHDIFRELSPRVTESGKTPRKADLFPGFVDLRKLAAKHDATFNDLRWSRSYACRMVGCLSVPNGDASSDKASIAAK
jgi:hypothetical protein